MSADRKTGRQRGGGGGLASISEADEAEDFEAGADSHVDLELGWPQWDSEGWLDEPLFMKGLVPDMVQHGPNTLDDMMESDDNIPLSVVELTVHRRSRPFDEGGVRWASYARTTASATDNFVAKVLKDPTKGMPHLTEAVRCQALCKAFAVEFGELTGWRHPFEFTATACLEQRDAAAATDGTEDHDDGAYRLGLSLEPYLEGAYVSYTDNTSWVNSSETLAAYTTAAQAFSHFTFERSRGRFLVCDLQGVGYVLTDPVVHTHSRERFGLAPTNFHQDGFQFFFSGHRCNDICTGLGLRSNKSMFDSGRFNFRGHWPNMLRGKIFCCSNKLCARAQSPESVQVWAEHPEHQWCVSCWPQLFSSLVRRLCISPGPDHEFDASLFFYQSQGQAVPRKCPEHRSKDKDSATKQKPASSKRNQNPDIPRPRGGRKTKS